MERGIFSSYNYGNIISTSINNVTQNLAKVNNVIYTGNKANEQNPNVRQPLNLVNIFIPENTTEFFQQVRKICQLEMITFLEKQVSSPNRSVSPQVYYFLTWPQILSKNNNTQLENIKLVLFNNTIGLLKPFTLSTNLYVIIFTSSNRNNSTITFLHLYQIKGKAFIQQLDINSKNQEIMEVSYLAHTFQSFQCNFHGIDMVAAVVVSKDLFPVL